MDSFDILIVGGGPAGSSLAYRLKDSGLAVAILDQRAFPRQKVCAGWVTPEVMRLLDINLEDYARGRVLQPITGFNIGLLGSAQVASEFEGEPVSYGIRRIEFDHYLLERCGAHLILDEALDTMIRSESGWVVNNRLQAKLLVGAGGHNCPVARAIGARPRGELAVVAQEVEFAPEAEQMARCNVREDVPELFFTPDLKGYGWVFRKGDYLNIGLGREDKQRLPAHVQAFCQFLEQAGKIPPHLVPDVDGHAYLLYHHGRRKLLADHAMLIGDAAGLAYPQSGEGIRPAVESALIAGDVILEAAGNYSADHLAPYEQRVEARYGVRPDRPGFTDRLPLSLKQFFASRLMKTTWFTRNVVIAKWFLQNHQPPLDGTAKTAP
jgi:geranylgeranyl reductase family protein